MGFGGSPSYDPPEVTPVPEKQATKSVSAGATMGPQKKREQHQKPMELDRSLTDADPVLDQRRKAACKKV